MTDQEEIARLQNALTRIGNLPLEFNTRARAIAQENVEAPPEGWRDHLTPAEIHKILYREPLHRAAKEKPMSTETKEQTEAYQPPTMEMIPVESSNIESVGHDGRETLRVTFKGSGSYDYVGVTEEEFFGLVNAPSVGKAYNALTRGRGIKGIKL